VSAALALLLFVGVRTLVLGSPLGLDRALIPRIDNPLAHVGALPRILTALELQMQAVWLLLFPVRLTPDRSLGAFTVVDSVTPIALAGGLLLLLGGALVMRRWISGRGPRPLGLVIGLAVLSWIPVSNLFVPTGTTLADRLLYVPSVAVCLLVAGFLVKVPRARLLFVPVVLSLALLSVLRVTVWSSEEGLYRDALRVVPGSARVLASVAWYDLEGGRFEEAEASASKALTVYPGYGKAHAIRAHALRGLGDWEQAGKEYRVVLTCENVSASDLHNLAAWLFSSEATLTRLLEAESLLFQALEEDSSFAPARELIDRVRERIASLRNANDLAPAGRRDR
jgi:hypothetical protein